MIIDSRAESSPRMIKRRFRGQPFAGFSREQLVLVCPGPGSCFSNKCCITGALLACLDAGGVK